MDGRLLLVALASLFALVFLMNRAETSDAAPGVAGDAAVAAVHASAPLALRVLCFGDSLTEGHMGNAALPYMSSYAITLEASLEEALGRATELEVVEKGRSGELVSDMPSRLEAVLSSRERSRKLPFDLMILLGGTNDAGRGRDATDIADNIEALHGVARQHGARSVVVTVPDLRVLVDGRDTPYMKTIDAVNERLRTFAAACAPECALFDLARQLPQTEETSALFASDGVHFTSLGYSVIGKQLADVVLAAYHLASP